MRKLVYEKVEKIDQVNEEFELSHMSLKKECEKLEKEVDYLAKIREPTPVKLKMIDNDIVDEKEREILNLKKLLRQAHSDVESFKQRESYDIEKLNIDLKKLKEENFQLNQFQKANEERLTDSKINWDEEKANHLNEINKLNKLIADLQLKIQTKK